MTSDFGLRIFLLASLVLASCNKEEPVIPSDEIHFSGILKTLKPDHPRLLLTNSRLDELKVSAKTDGQLSKYVLDVLAQADKDAVKAPIEHVLIGPRLLDKSREALKRIYNLSFAFRWTGNSKYLNSSISNMRTVCSFSDWNPSHFLDVAEMTHAVAIGYDWLFNYMSENDREFIRAGLKKHGLDEGKKAYTVSSYSYKWWTKVEHNWNQVCNSGLIIGVLAVAETDSSYAFSMLPHSIENLPYALVSYDPDGAWPEGPGYWDYATDYTAYGLSALETALGNTFGLTEYPGMDETGYFPIYSAGPAGLRLNYADVGEKSKLGAPHPLMWLANTYNNDHFSDFVEDQLKTRTADVWHIIWYRPYASAAMTKDLDRFFDGEVPLFFFRSSWTDQNALFVGFKAGNNRVNHAHLDLGNFEMDALGQRWVRDLGSDDYNLPGYFSTGGTGARWTYYRLNSFSHNVPVLGNRNQDVYAASSVINHAEGVQNPFAIVDLTQAYKNFASSAKRGLMVFDSRKSIIVQDEFLLSGSCDIVCGLTTDASVLLIDSQKAELSLNGRKVTARILSPDDGFFTIASAEQSAPQKPNTGVKRLLINKTAASGNVTVTMLLSPQWNGTENPLIPDVIPLSSW